MDRGKRYLIMTATHYWAGTLVSESHVDYVLARVTQVYSTGEMESACAAETWDEAEMYEPERRVWINRGAVVAMIELGAPVSR